MIKKVKEIINESFTWFRLEDERENWLTFATREHGDVCDEVPGEEDIKEAKRIRAFIKNLMPQLKVTIEVCDEWVHIDVTDEV